MGRLLCVLRWIENAALIGVAMALIVVVILQVLSRYAIGSYVSLGWTDEVARGFTSWLTFLGAGVLDRDREHIQVTIVTDLLGPWQKIVVGFLADLLCAAFLVTVLLSAIETLRVDVVTTMVTVPVPLAFVSGSLALGASAMLLHVVFRILSEAKRLFTAAPNLSR